MNIPDLPEADTIFDESVRSVYRRGFYDGAPPDIFTDPTLMLQYARLIEEIGEFDEAERGYQHNGG